jgi:3-oxoacyl-[acyl-carrier-protein] synthase II
VSEVVVEGWGAVSPAGWGVAALREAMAKGAPLATTELGPPGGRPCRVRQVPPPSTRPAFLAHPRLRRTSPIAQHTVAAALEALGPDANLPERSGSRLGIVFCAMAGCVNYSRRFYDETLKDPATASPLVFPETVFNSPASHLAALLGATSLNYPLVGDPGTFLEGVALGATWLLEGAVDGCLVVGAEELDWLLAEAQRLFCRAGVVSAGAGAVYLRRSEHSRAEVRLERITNPHAFSKVQSRAAAARRARSELGQPPEAAVLCDGLQGMPLLDRDEAAVWADWKGPRLSPKRICGEAFMASAAWQCVAGIDAVARRVYPGAVVSVVGCNEQAIAAQFA